MISILTADDIPSSFVSSLLYGSLSTQNLRTSSSTILYTLFEENSTRTRESFKIASNILGIPVVDIETKTSSITKGESIQHTIETLANYSQQSIFVIRASTRLQKFNIPNTSIINAGDGVNEHPTQALGDLLTIFKTVNTPFSQNFLQNINITICGDIENSRVARSNIKLLSRFGAKITLVAPPHLLQQNTAKYYEQQYNCVVHRYITQKIIEKANFLMFLRTQTERNSQFIDVDVASFTLNDSNLHFLKPSTFIMHPGPVNIGKELSHSAFYHKNSLINEQVKNALQARKALISWIVSNGGIIG
ncbi:MAG: aspartate carbamoyltransferase [Proteobacteria bacterium]|jgi:aspartate carbamoyltransferase catalytic subunit|nr:aspartate carbamoyltransferase [Pseudomonadota bacterium]